MRARFLVVIVVALGCSSSQTSAIDAAADSAEASTAMDAASSNEVSVVETGSTAAACIGVYADARPSGCTLGTYAEPYDHVAACVDRGFYLCGTTAGCGDKALRCIVRDSDGAVFVLTSSCFDTPGFRGCDAALAMRALDARTCADAATDGPTGD